jgi:hypothetical protein
VDTVDVSAHLPVLLHRPVIYKIIILGVGVGCGDAYDLLNHDALLFCLFNDAVSISGYIAPSGSMLEEL